MTPTHEQRPWGSFTVLDDAETHKVKRIEVDPGRRLSYQRHAHRSEHWFILTGNAEVTLDDVRHHLKAGDAIDVPRGTAHRIANVGNTEMAFIEEWADPQPHRRSRARRGVHRPNYGTQWR